MMGVPCSSIAKSTPHCPTRPKNLPSSKQARLIASMIEGSTCVAGDALPRLMVPQRESNWSATTATRLPTT
eukprot:5081916-Prymnesium_polylepis.1